MTLRPLLTLRPIVALLPRLLRPILRRSILARPILDLAVLALPILKLPILPLRAILAVLLLVTARLLSLIVLLRLTWLSLIVVAIDVAIEAITFAVVIIIVVDIFAAGPALFVEPRTAFTKHPEIMVRELEIILRLDTVAGELGVTRHALVFLEQLRRISTLAIVAGVAATVAGHSRGTLSTTTATAGALTIVNQRVGPRRTGA